MRPEPKLTITEFKNPAGSVSYRVSGVIDGERIRKNFPTRAEAAAEKQALEIEAMQRDFGMRRALTGRASGWIAEALGSIGSTQITTDRLRAKARNRSPRIFAIFQPGCVPCSSIFLVPQGTGSGSHDHEVLFASLSSAVRAEFQ
jgi:hypothetical protein